MKKGQESSVVGRLGKGYPQIPQFQISPNYKHHIENLPIYPFKEQILETIEKVILNFLFLIYIKKTNENDKYMQVENCRNPIHLRGEFSASQAK